MAAWVLRVLHRATLIAAAGVTAGSGIQPPGRGFCRGLMGGMVWAVIAIEPSDAIAIASRSAETC
jgi:hypothetical protein